MFNTPTSIPSITVEQYHRDHVSRKGQKPAKVVRRSFSELVMSNNKFDAYINRVDPDYDEVWFGKDIEVSIHPYTPPNPPNSKKPWKLELEKYDYKVDLEDTGSMLYRAVEQMYKLNRGIFKLYFGIIQIQPTIPISQYKELVDLAENRNRPKIIVVLNQEYDITHYRSLFKPLPQIEEIAVAKQRLEEITKQSKTVPRDDLISFCYKTFNLVDKSSKDHLKDSKVIAKHWEMYLKHRLKVMETDIQIQQRDAECFTHERSKTNINQIKHHLLKYVLEYNGHYLSLFKSNDVSQIQKYNNYHEHIMDGTYIYQLEEERGEDGDLDTITIHVRHYSPFQAGNSMDIVFTYVSLSNLFGAWSGDEVWYSHDIQFKMNNINSDQSPRALTEKNSKNALPITHCRKDMSNPTPHVLTITDATLSNIHEELFGTNRIIMSNKRLMFMLITMSGACNIREDDDQCCYMLHSYSHQNLQSGYDSDQENNNYQYRHTRAATKQEESDEKERMRREKIKQKKELDEERERLLNESRRKREEQEEMMRNKEEEEKSKEKNSWKRLFVRSLNLIVFLYLWYPGRGFFVTIFYLLLCYIIVPLAIVGMFHLLKKQI
ncbi:stress response protein nst1 [Acrasis kona]|uniref:Stress response protein nst1 n=1 Tax=Acrasis kona TaxID=1008807 RepID=A0AAW2ZPZ9_9EUKA